MFARNRDDTTTSQSSLKGDIFRGIFRRWEFRGWQTSATASNSNSWGRGGWDWGHAGSWTGTWEIGQLFKWTGIVLFCMIGGFFLIAFIFWAGGLLDERRLRRIARERESAEIRAGKKPEQQTGKQPKLVWKPLNQGENLVETLEMKDLDDQGATLETVAEQCQERSVQ